MSTTRVKNRKTRRISLKMIVHLSQKRFRKASKAKVAFSLKIGIGRKREKPTRREIKDKKIERKARNDADILTLYIV